VVVVLKDILAKLPHILPRTFAEGSTQTHENQNTNHASPRPQESVFRQLQEIQNEIEHENRSIGQTGHPLSKGPSPIDFLDDLFGPVQPNDRETAGGSKHDLDDIGSQAGGDDPPGHSDLQDDSYDNRIRLTPYMQAFRMALTKEYMQRMNATQLPGNEYTLHVACSEARWSRQAYKNQWNQMMLGLCEETRSMNTSFEDCSHEWEFVILYRKKETHLWKTLQVSRGTADVTGQFLMYIADAIWHLKRRPAWKKKLIDFLLAKVTMQPEHAGHRDFFPSMAH